MAKGPTAIPAAGKEQGRALRSRTPVYSFTSPLIIDIILVMSWSCQLRVELFFLVLFIQSIEGPSRG